MDDYEARLNAKLAPDSMKQTLIRAGAFLSAIRAGQAQVIDGVRGEYSSSSSSRLLPGLVGSLSGGDP